MAQLVERQLKLDWPRNAKITVEHSIVWVTSIFGPSNLYSHVWETALLITFATRAGSLSPLTISTTRLFMVK